MTMDTLRRKHLWSPVLLGGLAAAVWFTWATNTTEPGSDLPAEKAEIDPAVAKSVRDGHVGAAVPDETADARRRAALLARVEALNAKERVAEARQTDALVNAGWTPVASQPVDADVMALRSGAVSTKRQAIVKRLRSAALRAQDTVALARLAQQSDDRQLRTLAVEALGRIHDPAAQAALATLYDTVGDDPVRSRIVWLLDASSADGPAAHRLRRIVDDRGEPMTQRRRAAQQLAVARMVGAKAGSTGHDESWPNPADAESCQLLAEAIELLSEAPGHHG